MNDKLYLTENNELFEFLLEQRFFSIWREENKNYLDQTSLWRATKIELYLTSTCNQNCEYCYLVKNKELYPEEYNKKEIVLKNLEIIFNWMIKNNFYISTIEFYSGEIWHTQYGRDVLELTYQYAKKGLMFDEIMIPSNCSFLRNVEHQGYIQRYINNFRNLGKTLTFSISVDGKIIEDSSRPLNSGEKKNDDFYENMFLFAKHNTFYFHPMVSAHNVSYWKENFLWWMENLEKYNLLPKTLMMLEVRNDEWTKESIKDYNDFMNFLIDYSVQKYGLQEFVDVLVGRITPSTNDHPMFQGYIPFYFGQNETFPGCTIGTHLALRVGDLAVCPCHRTAYNKYLYGKFIVDNNEIIGYEGKNTQMMIRILFSNYKISSLGCDTCIIKDVCLRGCIGAQFESNNDPFLPCLSVCQFFIDKAINLSKKYNEIGVFDILRKFTPYEPSFLIAQKFIDVGMRLLKIDDATME